LSTLERQNKPIFTHSVKVDIYQLQNVGLFLPCPSKSLLILRLFMEQPTALEKEQEQKHELNTFLFLTIFLAPILSIALVGGFGFIVWMSQLIFGPPSL
jgi:nitrate reductase NapE